MKHNIILKSLSMALALSFVGTPLLTYGAVNLNVKIEKHNGNAKVYATTSASVSANIKHQENEQDTEYATSSKHTTLPPGIEHAPGIQKRIEDDKGLPHGILQRAFNFVFDHPTSTVPVGRKIEIKNMHIVRGTSTASISWITNASTSAEVRYGTTSPAHTASSTVITGGSLSQNHEVTIVGLTPGTKYYFQIIYTDASGNVRESKVFRFTTRTLDTVAPNILFVTTLGLHATSTRIVWITNESSDSRVWVSTSTPVVATTTPTRSSSALSFYHDLQINGLTASTTYFYTVSSTDNNGNVGVSTGGQFTTPAN